MNNQVNVKNKQKGGFTLVEVIFALILLSIGVLGLASFSVFAVRQVTAGDLRTERAAAIQSAVEQVRSVPWDSVQAGSLTVGQYNLGWTVAEATNSRVVTIVSTGPGMTMDNGSPTMSPSVADTMTIRVLRP